MKIIDIDRTKLAQHTQAFNPSICDVGSDISLWMAYRSENRDKSPTTSIRIAELSRDQFPSILSDTSVDLPEDSMYEDPRLFMHNGECWLSFIRSCIHDGLHYSCQGLCSIHWTQWDYSDIQYPDYGKNINHAQCGNGRLTREKNWTFFSHNERIHFIYSLEPYEVCRLEEDGSITRIIRNKPDISWWKYGEIRGSSSLLDIGECYLGVFHSMLYEWKGNMKKRNYVAGFYAVDKKTLEMIAVSDSPFLVARHDDKQDLRPLDQAWRPNVVFPCGIAHSPVGKDEFAVSFGWQDSLCKIAILSREEIIKSLRPIIRKQIEYRTIANKMNPPPGGFKFKHNGQWISSRTFHGSVIRGREIGLNESQVETKICENLPESDTRLVWR